MTFHVRPEYRGLCRGGALQEKQIAAAVALAGKIVANGQLAVRMAKRVIDEGLEASLPTALSLEMDATAHLFVTDDKREGIQAFVEKRPPHFSGR